MGFCSGVVVFIHCVRSIDIILTSSLIHSFFLLFNLIHLLLYFVFSETFTNAFNEFRSFKWPNYNQEFHCWLIGDDFTFSSDNMYLRRSLTFRVSASR